MIGLANSRAVAAYVSRAVAVQDGSRPISADNDVPVASVTDGRRYAGPAIPTPIAAFSVIWYSPVSISPSGIVTVTGPRPIP
jgi:hypothetical protein